MRQSGAISQKRLQNKRALMHARMRQGEAGVVALQIVIEQDVQIEGSGTVAVFAHPSVRMLNFEQGFEQVLRGQVCFYLSHRVDEIRLVEPPTGALR